MLGLQSIKPFRQECLEIDTCFLEEQLDRHGNTSKYAIPSTAASLEAFKFKISTHIQDTRYQITRIWDLELHILFSSAYYYEFIILTIFRYYKEQAHSNIP